MKNGYFIDEEQLAESEECFATVFGCLFNLAFGLVGLITAIVGIAVYFLLG